MTNSATSSAPISPGVLFANDGPYRARPSNFLFSFLIHMLGVAAVIAIATYVTRDPTNMGRKLGMVEAIGPITFPLSIAQGGGHGGGGDHEKLPASTGALPKMTLEDQLTPPEAVLRNLNPKLPEPPSVMALSAVPLPQLGQLGDPLSRVKGPLSNGPGAGGGSGSNCCGGVGPSTGPGFGDSGRGNIFQPGKGGVTAPRPIYDPDPDYSDAARKAKYQGSVLLWLVVGPDGRTRNLRVQRTLGMGLDEKALEAVSQWRFQPAMLNGQPVAVEINVEVSFRLY